MFRLLIWAAMAMRLCALPTMLWKRISSAFRAPSSALIRPMGAPSAIARNIEVLCGTRGKRRRWSCRLWKEIHAFRFDEGIRERILILLFPKVASAGCVHKFRKGVCMNEDRDVVS